MALIDKYTHKGISNIARRYAKPRAERTRGAVAVSQGKQGRARVG